MAKLNPPSISGALPSFYSNYNGAVNITVPFSMNKTVSKNEVWGFSLRIKTTTTDTVLGVIELQASDALWTNSVLSLTFFDIDQNIKKYFTIGSHYKLQLAYIGKKTSGTKGDVGYYSSLGIAKYTAEPSIYISGMEEGMTNLGVAQCIGVYSNGEDPSEKVYQYKFTLYDSYNKELESSGWLLHNTYEDESPVSSRDIYTIKLSLEPSVLYKIQYSICTNNNLEASTPKYYMMNAESVDSTLEATLHAELNYDNAYVAVYLTGDINAATNKEKSASGSFVLSRASSDTGFNIWTMVHDFQLKNQLPSNFLFKDFAIEHGVTYRYAIQQYNSAGIYSNRKYAEDVLAQFEDAYLYDGDRQLRIRFNPKVTSFKTNYLDTKKTTLGHQYPFIFRNGAVAYKEFPISGLISYGMDENGLFMPFDDALAERNFITDITDENVLFERKFKLQVLDWLNDGNIKLFKSPTEGNYLVRLMNVSLSPNDSLSRMLHTFSCTANEIATYNIENLTAYNFLNTGITDTSAMRWSSVVLNEFVDPVYQKFNTSDVIQSKVAEKNLTGGLRCYHCQITDVLPGTKFKFTFDNQSPLEIIIGITGSYETRFETNEPATGIYLLSPQRRMNGIVTLGVYTSTTNTFDAISKLNLYDVALMYARGPREDLFADYVDIKHEISRVYFARFSQIEVTPVANLQALKIAYFNAGTAEDLLIVDNIYFTMDTQKYYKYIGRNKVNQSLTQDEQFAQALQEFEYTTTVQWDDRKFSVEQDNEIFIPELSPAPQSITIGSGVLAELSFQIKEVTYNVEANLAEDRATYLNAYETWRAKVVNLAEATAAQIADKNVACYYFINDSFYEMRENERLEYDSSVKVAWALKNSNDYSDDEIAAARKDYDDARSKFLTALEEALKTQEIELEQDREMNE